VPDIIHEDFGVLDTPHPEDEEPEVFMCEFCGAEHDCGEAAYACCNHECDYCGTIHRDEDSAYECCRHECPSCGAEHRYEDEAQECCMYRCPDCGATYDYEEDARDCCRSSREFYGSLPVLPDTDPYRVEVPAIPGRPARLCSVEQELASGGAMVAALLCQQGLSTMDYVTDYHHGPTGRGTAHVEEDGSLPSEGGEVVYDRFNLASDQDAERLGSALTKIRQLRDTPGRPVTTSYSAGIHVHLAARAENGSTLGPRDLAALYELWSYAEDMLYSFSAAGWSRHRQPTDHGGYCKPVPKEPGVVTPRKVWRLMRSDRYYGLNFQRLFHAVSSCGCGAATMGDWASCDCGAFDRATVEWRVFNSSTLPRTIHAWLLMAHAMTAYAHDHELGTLPENPYGTQSPAEKREVLDHLLEILPLTDGERVVIREAANRSPGL
jgi:hypothetical protein